MISRPISNLNPLPSYMKGVYNKSSTYEITNMFRFYSKNDKLSIILDIIKLDKHPIYYLVKLLNKILDILS